MRQFWPKILPIFFILLGIGLILFVVRMVWFPPSSMGMMMGKDMMMHHVIFMFIPLLLFSIIFTLIFTIWSLKHKSK